MKQSLHVQPRLSPQAVRFVARHPEQLDSLVAVALEAAAAQDALPSREQKASGGSSQDTLEINELSATPVLPATLTRFVKRAPSSAQSLLNVSDAAKRLGISRPTIYAWIASKRLLGWQVTHRGPVIPAEQILGPRRIVAGLSQVLEVIPDPAVVWDFLTQETTLLNSRLRPIDALKAGRISEVVAAARSHGTAFI